MCFSSVPTRATLPAHLILIYLIALVLVPSTNHDRSSSCRSLQFPVTRRAPYIRTHSVLVLPTVTQAECDTCTDKNSGSLNWSCVKQMYQAFREIVTASSRVLQTVKPNWYFERDRQTHSGLRCVSTSLNFSLIRIAELWLAAG